MSIIVVPILSLLILIVISSVEVYINIYRSYISFPLDTN